MNPMRHLALGLIFSILMPTQAWAEASEQPLRAYVSAYGFATVFNQGNMTGPLTYSIDVPFTDTWDHLDMWHTAYIGVAKGRWGTYLDKQYIKASVSDDINQARINIKAKRDRTNLGVYFTAINTGDNDSKNNPSFTLEPTIGLQFTRVSADLKAELMGQTLSASRASSWYEPYIGTRFKYNFNQNWLIAGRANIGNAHTKDYLAYLAYQTKLLNKPVNLRVGYRLLDQKHTRGDFIWDVKEKGPTLGFSMQLF